MMNRLVQFVRSVIPADLFQLIFLVGVVCLTVAPHLRWWPPQPDLTDLPRLSQESSQQARFEWAMFMSGAIWPIILSGMAGYFVCFWPGRRSQRRILWAVCLPAILGVGLICIRYLSLQKSSVSILESGNMPKQNLVWAMASLWELGPGLRFSVLGILLIAIFALRVGFGILCCQLLYLRMITRRTKRVTTGSAFKFLSGFLLPRVL